MYKYIIYMKLNFVIKEKNYKIVNPLQNYMMPLINNKKYLEEKIKENDKKNKEKNLEKKIKELLLEMENDKIEDIK